MLKKCVILLYTSVESGSCTYSEVKAKARNTTSVYLQINYLFVCLFFAGVNETLGLVEGEQVESRPLLLYPSLCLESKLKSIFTDVWFLCFVRRRAVSQINSVRESKWSNCMDSWSDVRTKALILVYISRTLAAPTSLFYQFSFKSHNGLTWERKLYILLHFVYWFWIIISY